MLTLKTAVPTGAVFSPWCFAAVVGAIVFCVTIMAQPRVLASQDLYLHIATGRWILDNGQIPHRGIFSATMAQAPWVAHEWLPAVCFALLYDHLGWGGVLVLVGALLAIAIAVVAGETARSLGPVAALCAALLAWGLTQNHLVARPHVAALPLAAVWVALHVRARRREAVPPLWSLALMTLWANVHGSFAFGLGFSALFAAEAAFEADPPRSAIVQLRRWGGFLGIAVLAAMITPNGLQGLLFPLHMMTLGPALAVIYEWQSSSLTNNAPLIFWVLLVVFGALATGLRVPICRLAMFLLLLYMAFAHRRHSELLGLASPLLLQDAIADQWSPAGSMPTRQSEMLLRPPLAFPVAGIALGACLLAAAAFGRDVVRGADKYTPAAALDAVKTRAIEGPVLNAQNFGGYLIFNGYSPFVDGRIDLYGNEFMARYNALDQLPELLRQYHIRWTIFEPFDPRVLVLDRLPGWSRVYSDGTAVVHLRQELASP